MCIPLQFFQEPSQNGLFQKPGMFILLHKKAVLLIYVEWPVGLMALYGTQKQKPISGFFLILGRTKTYFALSTY